MNCAIPVLVSIFAANPCGVWELAQREFSEARKIAWYAEYTSAPLRGANRWDRQEMWRDDLGSVELHIIERKGFSFSDPETGAEIAGEFDTPFSSVVPPVIRFASQRPQVLRWEFLHFIYWRNRDGLGDAWKFAGHGLEGDPLFDACLQFARLNPFAECQR